MTTTTTTQTQANPAAKTPLDPERVIAPDGPKPIEDRALAVLEGIRRENTEQADDYDRKAEAARLRGKDDQAKFCKEQGTLFRLIARRIAIGMGAKLATESQAAPPPPARVEAQPATARVQPAQAARPGRGPNGEPPDTYAQGR